ncbi:hypothetical protein RB7262 [Rhodopirellula baltica SH 1]|uniref:Uncharacterized protein n=1 Tax=Rhodopirellula baltica (strain DSM 10527 / NCIMB 13988 / SH1) TaxID=243090 RepID=Q7UNZ0_RHOBA|nr:hypothetical protein RB7262 [Rhodopirellula baltica SH 1]
MRRLIASRGCFWTIRTLPVDLPKVFVGFVRIVHAILGCSGSHDDAHHSSS